jgi:hypothetical protein
MLDTTGTFRGMESSICSSTKAQRIQFIAVGIATVRHIRPNTYNKSLGCPRLQQKQWKAVQCGGHIFQHRGVTSKLNYQSIGCISSENFEGQAIICTITVHFYILSLGKIELGLNFSNMICVTNYSAFDLATFVIDNKNSIEQAKFKAVSTLMNPS